MKNFKELLEKMIWMKNFKELLNVSEEIMYCVKEKFVCSLPDKDDICIFIGTKEDCLEQIDNCNDIDEFGQYISDYMYYMEPSNIIFNLNYLNDLFVNYDINDNSFDKACETLKNYLMDEYDEYTDNIDDFNKYKTIKQRNGKISDDIKAITEIKKEYEIYLESKERIAMSNKLTKMIETVNNENKKEVIVMTREERIKDMAQRIEDIRLTSDEGYVTKDMMVDLISEVMGNRPNPKKHKRNELADIIFDIYHNLEENKTVTEDKPFVTVGDLAITNDNAPSNLVNNQLIDDTTSTTTLSDVVFDDKLAMTILKNIILQADKNSQHNFISDWMLTSIISELTIGYPLKGKDKNNKWQEFYKTFDKEQKSIIAKIRYQFIQKSKFVPSMNGGKVTGYHIPAKSLVYGRHMWLNKACVYKFHDIEYHVSLNGIKNTKTGNITKLSDDAYATLDSKCVFFK